MPKQYYAIELDNFEGKYGAIYPENTVFYAAGAVDDDGVIRFVDNGYPTLAELKAAWPEITIS